MRRLAAARAALVLLIAAVAFGCDVSKSAAGLEVTGIVVGVDGPNVAEVDGFTLRTADGQVVEFAVDELSLADGGKAAPHLREHMASGAPIVVEYQPEAQGGAHVALRYTDAP